MYDRNGKLLVSNQPAYDVMVCMRNIRDLDTLSFCHSLGITKEYFDKRMADVKNRRLNPGYSSYTNQLFLSQLTAEDFAKFQEQLYKFSGFSIQRRTIRQYNYPVAGHLFGDLGEVSKNDITKDNYYVQGDFIGKQGIESFYEKLLRGEKGKEVLLRDAYGRVKGRYMDGAKDVAPIAGKNLTLSLDIELQALAERLLQNKIGSVVAIEPSTGEVLCMASSPTFDPQMLVGRKRGENHRLLSQDKQKPLLNRAIMGTYPPGSTFKTSQALTFLQEGIVTPTTSFPCSMGFNHKGLHVGCHAHGSPIALAPSLATSCNSWSCWASTA
jgi:penicillin-binding protein 2